MLKEILSCLDEISIELEKLAHWDLSKKTNKARDKIKRWAEEIREGVDIVEEIMDDMIEEQNEKGEDEKQNK